MPTETKLADAILEQSGWSATPAVTTIDEDPDTAGGDWIDPAVANGSGTSSPIVRVSFPTPTGDPTGVQTFKARLGQTVSGGTSPTARIDLYENGVLLASGTNQTISTLKSAGGQVISQTFDLATTPLSNTSGADVEARVVITGSGGSNTNKRSASLDSVNWDTVNYTSSTPVSQALSLPIESVSPVSATFASPYEGLGSYIWNDAEGGTSGVLPTTSDTGSGTQLAEVLVPAGGTVEYINTPVLGGLLAYHIKTGGTAGTTGIGLSLGDDRTWGYHRIYFRHNGATIATAFNILNLRTSAGVAVAFLDISASKKLRLKGGNSTVIWTSTNDFTEDTRWRIEVLAFVNGTTSVSLQVKIFAGDSTTPSEDSGILTGTANSAIASYRAGRAGQLNTAVANSPDLYVDDIVLFANTWVGPSSTLSAVSQTLVLPYEQLLKLGGRSGYKSLRVDAYTSLATLQGVLNEAVTNGAQHVRFSVQWDQIETADGTFNWTPIDNVVSETVSRGLKTTAHIIQTPAWVGTSGNWDPPVHNSTQLGHWHDFCQTLAARYGGDIGLYEIWNEPNGSGFWQSGSPTANWPTEYAALLRNGAEGLRAGDPDIQIAAINTSRPLVSGYMEAVYDALEADVGQATCQANGYYFDVLSVHPYCLTHSPDVAAGSDDIADSWGGSIGRCFLDFTRSRDIVEAREGAPKPMYMGEFGYNTDGSTNNGPVADATRATYLQTAYDLIRADGGVIALTWYAWKQSTSVWDIDGTATETAFQNVAQASDGTLKELPVEALSGLSSTKVSPIEARAVVVATTLIPWEAQTGAAAVSQTFIIPLESLTSALLGQSLPFESVVPLTKQVSVPWEGTIYLASQMSSAYESAQLLSKLYGNPVESLGSLSATAIQNFESGGIGSNQIIIPWEANVFLSSLTVAQLEWLQGITKVYTPATESLGGITSALLLPLESGGKATMSVALFFEAAGPISSPVVIPYETAQALSKLFAPVLEALQGITKATTANFDSTGFAVAVAQALELFIESIQPVTTGAIVLPWEGLIPLSATKQSALEALGGINSVKAGNLDAAGFASLLRELAFESAGPLSQQATATIESLSQSAKLYTVPFESILGASATYEEAYEAIGLTSSQADLPWDSWRVSGITYAPMRSGHLAGGTVGRIATPKTGRKGIQVGQR